MPHYFRGPSYYYKCKSDTKEKKPWRVRWARLEGRRREEKNKQMKTTWLTFWAAFRSLDNII